MEIAAMAPTQQDAAESDVYSGDSELSPASEFGHVKRGYAVEFNLDEVCACRTLTMETEAEAETFKQLLESRDDTGMVRVVRDV